MVLFKCFWGGIVGWSGSTISSIEKRIDLIRSNQFYPFNPCSLFILYLSIRIVYIYLINLSINNNVLEIQFIDNDSNVGKANCNLTNKVWNIFTRRIFLRHVAFIRSGSWQKYIICWLCELFKYVNLTFVVVCRILNTIIWFQQ